MTSMHSKRTPEKRIWGVECSGCKKRMFSFHVHDYKTCGCPVDTMVDGGRDYLRSGWMPDYKQPRRIYWTEKQDGKYPRFKPIKDRFPY